MYRRKKLSKRKPSKKPKRTRFGFDESNELTKYIYRTKILLK